MMKVYNHELEVRRNETFTIDKYIENRDGSPYIISKRLLNPYFLITLTNSQYDLENRYAYKMWLPFEGPRFEDTNPVDISIFKTESGDTMYSSFDTMNTLPSGYVNRALVTYERGDEALFYEVQSDGTKVYKYWNDDAEEWRKYQCRLIAQFPQYITKDWVERSYIYNIDLVDGNRTIDYLVSLCKQYKVGGKFRIINVDNISDVTDVDIDAVYSTIENVTFDVGDTITVKMPELDELEEYVVAYTSDNKPFAIKISDTYVESTHSFGDIVNVVVDGVAAKEPMVISLQYYRRIMDYGKQYNKEFYVFVTKGDIAPEAKDWDSDETVTLPESGTYMRYVTPGRNKTLTLGNVNFTQVKPVTKYYKYKDSGFEEITEDQVQQNAAYDVVPIIKYLYEDLKTFDPSLVENIDINVPLVNYQAVIPILEPTKVSVLTNLKGAM